MKEQNSEKQNLVQNEDYARSTSQQRIESSKNVGTFFWKRLYEYDK